MPENTIDQREALQDALLNIALNPSFAQTATHLLDVLGYRSAKTADLGNKPEAFLANLEELNPGSGKIDRTKIQANKWKSSALLFQLTNDEIPSLALNSGQQSMFMGLDDRMLPNQIDSFVFLAIELEDIEWSRTNLAKITRELNKRFPMPAIVLFRYAGLFSIAVIDRRPNKLDPNRDVLNSKVTLIKDVSCSNPHRAHIEILHKLVLANLGEKRAPNNFRELYDAWIAVLSTQKLNKEFYKKLSWWYQWAVKEVEFPQGGGKDRNDIGVIRLITRLIFIWFIKERGLVPEALFDLEKLHTILKQPPLDAPEESNYYQAILQNLFFATLNVEMGEARQWAKTSGTIKADYLISHVYRYKEAFCQPDSVLQDYFKDIPFLNGGLFECLDRQLDETDLAFHPELKELAVVEGHGTVLRVDGFSRRSEAQAKVPNKLFFGGAKDVDLSADLGSKAKIAKVEGLIDILSEYVFTVDENTALNEEVALDPELLGLVFENLLASYNPDTRETARKKSGSFYTPREVVDYMVDEALINYFANKLPDGQQRREDLRLLLKEDQEKTDPFAKTEADALVAAIEQLKVLDPACGSGAFPMGVLNKLFLVLQKLDPDNQRWRDQNLKPLKDRLGKAKKIKDAVLRDREIEDAEAALEKHKKDFAEPSYADYTRKLYLIENCLFGSDIQPIAVQIAKLRFFIALIVSQPIDRRKANWGITPLPNLETKIVSANTLFSVPRRGDTQGSLFANPNIAVKENELRDANAAYFTARTHASKKRRKETVQNLHKELVALLEGERLIEKQDAIRMARWDPFDQNRFADFFDVEWMFGMPRAKDGSEAVFDIVIGNPPYVRQENIKDIKPLLKDTYKYECYTGTADLFVYFYERSVKLLKPQGVLSFITSNKWYRANYGGDLRLFMATHTRLLQIIDFGDEPVFEAIAYPTIVISERRAKPINPPPAEDQFQALNWQKTYGDVAGFVEVFVREAFAMPQNVLKKEGWQLEPAAKRDLLARIKKAGTPLGDYVKGRFYYGIKTGLNEAFVIDAATREKLIKADPKSSEVIKPFLRGRDVKRWSVEFDDQYLIKIESSENVPHPWSEMPNKEAEKVFAETYPAIFSHFKKYKKAMKDRYDQGKYYWELRACAYWQEFEQPKLIVPAIAAFPSFAPDLSGYYSNNKSTIYLVQKTHFALGVLNSSVNRWFATQVCSSKQNGYFDFEPVYSSQLVVPNASPEEISFVESVVQGILVLNSPNLEQLLNGLVYELFFPEDLHAANIRLFDACQKAGLDKLSTLKGKALEKEALAISEKIFANNHPIYAMLFNLQAIPVVRTIEGR